MIIKTYLVSSSLKEKRRVVFFFKTKGAVP